MNILKKISFLVLAMCICFPLQARRRASAVVTYTIGSIDPIVVSGNPGPLIIKTTIAGGTPTPAVDSSTTYGVTTNITNERVTGSLAMPMPKGLTLKIHLQAPSRATSAGAVVMGTKPVNLVTGIGHVAENNLMITYILSATADASVIRPTTNTVTYTIGP